MSCNGHAWKENHGGVRGLSSIVERIRARVGEYPLYLSIDIDVLDPAHAPGTGTPEVAGLTTGELLQVLRGLAGLRLVATDVVEVCPAYDHAEITALAAATVAYEVVNLFACGRTVSRVTIGSSKVHNAL